MKKWLFSIVLFTWAGLASAQVQLSVEQQNELISSVTKITSSMQTMKCSFVQQKTMAMLMEPTVSKGVMYYVSPDKMRWEYIEPYQFALVFNGEKIIRIKEGKAEVLDANQGKMYKSLADLMIGCVVGNKLFDASAFDMVFYDEGSFWKMEMTPKRRDMKRMISQLVFYFDKTKSIVSQVEYRESNGDTTMIRFEDVQMNEVVEMSLFP
ncbi:MAG: outer membrane lipoprotein carrier protein LolA [Bacteroidales bacterium]|nr:outer membrane lipoprotein carrier protein LolA [Bacteroidales bacterium]